MAIKVQGITVIDDGRNIINGIGASFTGIVTATTFVGSGASLTNISNTALTNNSVNYGGVTVSLGGTDATPAFNLSDATDYPTFGLIGILIILNLPVFLGIISLENLVLPFVE